MLCISTATDCSQWHAAKVLEMQQAHRAVAAVASAAQAAREAWSRSLIRGLSTLQLQDGMQLQAFAHNVLHDSRVAQ